MKEESRKIIRKCASLCRKSYDKAEMSRDGFQPISSDETGLDCFIKSEDGITWVVFRGTETDQLNDICTDLMTFRVKTPFLPDECRVHAGFLGQYMSGRTLIIDTIKYMANPKVVCTGHSLGGGLSTLCALDVEQNVEGDVETYCVTYGSPRVGGGHFCRLFDAVIDNRNALGFHIPGYWDKILDLEQCHLQDTQGNELRDFIKDQAQELGLIFFDPRAQTGHLRTLMLRNTTLGQWMVLIQFYEDPGPLRDQLLKSVAEAFPEVNSLLYVINQKANDTLYDQNIQVFHGKEYIEEAMGNLRFRINAKSFYQTNSKQAIGLYDIVKEFAGLTGDQGVYDLYTGTGTIAQYVADKAKWVVGIEAVPDAIQAAKENAQRNNIENAQFFVGDMKELFDEDFITKHGKADVVITDPPRDGMHKSVVAQLLVLGAPRIVYVSCNSATQARDLALMKEHYKVVKSRAVDMFPQTHHVENVVLLEKIQ